jgi:hypothetical protein
MPHACFAALAQAELATAREELTAVAFTQESKVGRQLMAKCRSLQVRCKGGVREECWQSVSTAHKRVNRQRLLLRSSGTPLPAAVLSPGLRATTGEPGGAGPGGRGGSGGCD